MPPIASSSSRNPTSCRTVAAALTIVTTIQGLLAGAQRASARGWSDWERPLCAASNPWIFGTIVSAAARNPRSSRTASASARNRRHVARIVSRAARNPRLCSDCERDGSSRLGVTTVTLGAELLLDLVLEDVGLRA